MGSEVTKIIVEKMPFDFVPLLALVIALAAFLVAIITASARKATKYQLINALLDFRYSNKTLEARKALRRWHKKCCGKDKRFFFLDGEKSI